MTIEALYETRSDSTYRADGSIRTEEGFVYEYEEAEGRLDEDRCTSNYDWDGFDRLITHDPKLDTTNCGPTEAPTSTYYYDGLDRQRRREKGSEDTLLHYAGQGTTSVVERTGATDRAYTTDLNLNPVAVTEGGATEFLADDGQGNVSSAVLASDSTNCRVRYDPWGTPKNAMPSSENPCEASGETTLTRALYRGEIRDPGSGTYQLGSRTYDPTKAGFLTPDSHRAGPAQVQLSVGVDPLTRNRYSYVNGDPVNFVDPSGHMREPHGRWDGRGPNALTGGVTKAALSPTPSGASDNERAAWTNAYGDCLESLACDISVMTTLDRRIFLEQFDREVAWRFRARGDFAVVDAVLQVAEEQGIDTSMFFKTVDAQIVQGIQDGAKMALAERDGSNVSAQARRNPGGAAWKKYFQRSATADRRNAATQQRLIALWGEAEDKNTAIGKAEALELGYRPTATDDRLDRYGAFYRRGLRDPRSRALVAGLKCMGRTESECVDISWDVWGSFNPQDREFVYKMSTEILTEENAALISVIDKYLGTS